MNNYMLPFLKSDCFAKQCILYMWCFNCWTHAHLYRDYGHLNEEEILFNLKWHLVCRKTFWSVVPWVWHLGIGVAWPALTLLTCQRSVLHWPIEVACMRAWIDHEADYGTIMPYEGAPLAWHHIKLGCKKVEVILKTLGASLMRVRVTLSFAIW